MLNIGKFMKQERKAIFVNSVCFSLYVYNFLSFTTRKQSLLSLESDLTSIKLSSDRYQLYPNRLWRNTSRYKK